MTDPTATFDPRALSDPYCYLGSTVLVNKLGITNAANLHQAEQFLSGYNDATLVTGQIDISPDGLRAVHHHLFGDLYEWAGEYRTVDLGHMPDDGGPLVTFAPNNHIDNFIHDTFTQIRTQPAPSDGYELAGQAAALAGNLNWIHPFREGNGRTLRTFLTHWAHHHGYHIDFRSWTQAEWARASINAYHQHHDPMIDLVVSHLNRLQHGDLQRTVLAWGEARLDYDRFDDLVNQANSALQFSTSLHRDTLADSITELAQRRDTVADALNALNDRLTIDAQARGLAVWQLSDPAPNHTDHRPDPDTIVMLGAVRQHHDTWLNAAPAANGATNLATIKNMHRQWTDKLLIRTTAATRQPALEAGPDLSPTH